MSILPALFRPSQTFRPAVATAHHRLARRWSWLARVCGLSRPPHLLETSARHLIAVERERAALTAELMADPRLEGTATDRAHTALTDDVIGTRARIVRLVLGATADEPLAYEVESSAFHPVRSLRVGRTWFLLVSGNETPCPSGCSPASLLQNLDLVIVEG